MWHSHQPGICKDFLQLVLQYSLSLRPTLYTHCGTPTFYLRVKGKNSIPIQSSTGNHSRWEERESILSGIEIELLSVALAKWLNTEGMLFCLECLGFDPRPRHSKFNPVCCAEPPIGVTNSKAVNLTNSCNQAIWVCLYEEHLLQYSLWNIQIYYLTGDI